MDFPQHSGCTLVYSGGCVLTDTAMLHPDFLTVFLDLTCHPCQQSPGDLLANGATVGAPCDGAEASQSPRHHTPPCFHPSFFLPLLQDVVCSSFYLFSISSPFLSLQGFPPHIPLSEPCVHLVLRLSFSFLSFFLRL